MVSSPSQGHTAGNWQVHSDVWHQNQLLSKLSICQWAATWPWTGRRKCSNIDPVMWTGKESTHPPLPWGPSSAPGVNDSDGGPPQSLLLSLLLSVVGKLRQLNRLINRQNQLCPVGLEKIDRCHHHRLELYWLKLTSSSISPKTGSQGIVGKHAQGLLNATALLEKDPLCFLQKFTIKQGNFLVDTHGHRLTTIRKRRTNN